MAAASPITNITTHIRTLFLDRAWPSVVLVWAVYAGVSACNGFAGVIDQMSTDDAMRLVEVRDLLAGQSWFDLTQHRLDPPHGVIMHWSRVIDLPIALLLAGLKSMVGDDLAVRLTITIWPLLLFLPALLAAASISRTLAGSSAGPKVGILCAVMMVLSPAVTQRFAPAGIDHHGAQIALALTLLACTLRLDPSRAAAIGAGVAAATMMAIGLETAPHIAACAGFIALRWAVTGEAGMARGAHWFGMTFAVATALIAVVTLAPSSWLAPVCDTLGIGYIVAAGIAGMGLALATRYVPDGVWPRLAALGGIGVAVMVALKIVAPACLGSPYAALPEKLRTDWLDRVKEAQSLFTLASDDPTTAIAVILPLLVLIAVAAWAVWAAPRDRRWQAGTVAAMCAAACAVTVWQVRGVNLAFALGGPLLPLAVLAIGQVGNSSRLKSMLYTGLALVVLTPATLSLTGLGLAKATGLSAMGSGEPESALCPAQDYHVLDRLAPGLVLNTTDTGPFILAFSKHSVIAGPYHRDVDGLMTELAAFQGDSDAARAIARSRHAAYVVACPIDGGIRPDATRYPHSLSAALFAGHPPTWLQPVDLGTDAKLKAYRVVDAR